MHACRHGRPDLIEEAGRRPESDRRCGPALRSRGSGLRGPIPHVAFLTYSPVAFGLRDPVADVSGPGMHGAQNPQPVGPWPTLLFGSGILYFSHLHEDGSWQVLVDNLMS